jgi:hypothetical protein
MQSTWTYLDALALLTRFSPSLWEHRLRQRRPISRNPFEPEDLSTRSYDIAAIESPGPIRQNTKFDDSQPSDTSNTNSREDIHAENKNMDLEWGEQAPSWLNLVRNHRSLELSTMSDELIVLRLGMDRNVL